MKEFKNLKDLERFAKEYVLSNTFTIKLPNGQTKEVNLIDMGYAFKFKSHKRSIGKCNVRHKIISLSKGAAKLNLDKPLVIYDVLLHEVAHAISFELFGFKGLGHNKYFKYICRQLDCTSSCDLNEDIKMPKGKYTLVCPGCGQKTQLYRKPTRNKSCGKCSQTYNPDYKMEVIQNY